jgi:hypothetical protein
LSRAEEARGRAHSRIGGHHGNVLQLQQLMLLINSVIVVPVELDLSCVVLSVPMQ